MIVRNWVIVIRGGAAQQMPLRVGTYPAPGAGSVYQDAVVKVFFSGPVAGVDTQTLTVSDSHGVQVPGWVDQIGDGTWGFFPNQVILSGGERYAARLKAGICDLYENCIRKDIVWSFAVSKDPGQGSGDTSIPVGFRVPAETPLQPASSLRAAGAHRRIRNEVRIATK
jgi:hypothetical protein